MNQERVYSLVSRTMKVVSCGWRTHLADTFGSMLLPWCRAIFGPPVLWESALTSGRKLHATNPWTNGSRIMIIAHTVRRPHTLSPTLAEYLLDLGFMLPGARYGHTV